MAKKRIKQNKWDNINGYIGNKKSVEFGTDFTLANIWLTNEAEYKTIIAEAKDKVSRPIQL